MDEMESNVAIMLVHEMESPIKCIECASLARGCLMEPSVVVLGRCGHDERSQNQYHLAADSRHIQPDGRQARDLLTRSLWRRRRPSVHASIMSSKFQSEEEKVQLS
jgi:hypothetical protein